MAKIFVLLRRFSTVEIKQFQSFLHQPHYNKRPDVHRLLEFWLKNKADFSKEQAHNYVFQSKSFQASEWHLVTSRLYKLGELFLAIQEMLEDPAAKKIFAMKAYRKKNLEHLFNLTLKETQKRQEKQALRNTDWLQNEFYLENEYYDYVASHNRKKRTNLQEVNDLLEINFFANKLKIACRAVTRKTINQELYQIEMLDEVLEKVAGSPELLKAPAINVYYYCYKAITDTEGEYWFTNLRKAMTVHKSCFPPSERRDILLLAINYCIRRLNTGSEVFVREAFELYRLSLSEGTLLEDGILPESTYNNVVSLAVKLKEFDWAAAFIDENRKYLKPVFQEPMYYYSLGKLLFEQNQLDDSLMHLAKVDTKTSFLLLGAKTLQIKIFYKQKEIDALESLLESLRIYLQRSKVLGYRKSNYENFIYFVRKLLEIETLTKKEKLKLISEVNASEILTEREWVLAEIKV